MADRERGGRTAKRVTGRKWHALVNAAGRALMLQVDTASAQDREGAAPLKASRRGFPLVTFAFAEAGFTVHPWRPP